MIKKGKKQHSSPGVKRPKQAAKKSRNLKAQSSGTGGKRRPASGVSNEKPKKRQGARHHGSEGANELDSYEHQYRVNADKEELMRFTAPDGQPLLPIKVKGKGLVKRMGTRKQHSSDEEAPSEKDSEDDDDSGQEHGKAGPPQPPPKPMRLSEVLQAREDAIREKKFFIGSMCGAILENPEGKISHLATLLPLMLERDAHNDTVNLFAIRLTAMISLAEVFKDVIPEYRIGIVDKEQQKLKKDTLTRVNYESELLLFYKQYLRNLESVIGLRRKKSKASGKRLTMEAAQLVETACECMCSLLETHPYFNYSTNVAQVLIILLNNPSEAVRKLVYACFTSIFKTDTRLDLSLHIVRHINTLVKKKECDIFSDVITCLKYLQIHRINLNDEDAKEQKQKQLERHKSRVINMSRMERKRKKKLQELERDLFEMKAEESKKVRLSKLTDISKLAFTIYFRVLKMYPNSKVLSATLEGLAQFAHTINTEFFADLVELLNKLLVNVELGYREQLHCIQTVFTILLWGHGEALNIDLARFYGHFYRNMLFVSAGKNHEDVTMILKTLDLLLLKRRKNVTYHRHLGFIKRLATLCLHLLPNGTLGVIAVIRSSLQMNASLDILLDTESDVGTGAFDPFISELEFSNFTSTALYEMVPMQRHYHPLVRKYAKNIVRDNGVNSMAASLDSGNRVLTPSELYSQYDCTEMNFNPPVPSQVKGATPNAKRMAAVSLHREAALLEEIVGANVTVQEIAPPDNVTDDGVMFDFFNFT